MRESATLKPLVPLTWGRSWNNAMAFIPVENVLETEVRMLLDNQKIENTLYWFKDVGWDVAAATTLAADLLVWWNVSYAVPLSTQLSLREIYCTDLSTATSFTHTQPAPAPAPTGDVDFESEPNQVAISISFRTNLRGRSFRGRNYVSGLPGNGVLQNTVEPGTVAGIVAAYNSLFTVAATNGVEWSVVSRYSGVDGAGKPIPRAAGISTTITSVIAVDPTVDSQRRRSPGRGQ